MTNEDMQELIEKINIGSELIISRPIGKNVVFAKVWTQSPSMITGSIENGDDCYFIKDITGKYIGSVLVMGSSDLHVFLEENYRGQGYMTMPFETIYCHIYFVKKKVSKM
jgi:hypothetical protein